MIRKFFGDGIPSFFNNYDTGAPFTTCTFCDVELATKSKYAIEKMINQNITVQSREIVYEYALCWDCAKTMGSTVSDDSKKAIKELYNEHSETVMRKLGYLHHTEKYSLESWLERCSLTGKEIRLCGEFSVSGIVEGGNLVYEQSPIVVSDEFMHKLQQVLSKETKEGFDGLRDKILNVSPSIEDLILGHVPGLI